MDRNELKIEAFRQRIAELTVQYEDQIAEHRINITMLVEENERLKKEAEDRDGVVEEAKPTDPTTDS